MRVPHPRHLLHVVSKLELSSVTMNMVDWITELREYQHTVMFEHDILTSHPDFVWVLQNAGVTLTYVTGLDGPHEFGPIPDGVVSDGKIADVPCDAVILHSVTGHGDIELTAPTIYYSYGIYAPPPGIDQVLFCSEYAKQTLRRGPNISKIPHSAKVLPPGVPARALRRGKAKTEKFCVGIVNTGAYGKYPMGLVRYFLTHLLADTQLLLICPDKHREEVDALAEGARCSVDIRAVRVLPQRHILNTVDTLVQAYAPGYNSPYSRTTIEAMAMGIPVVCQRSGFLAGQLTDRKNCLFFDDRADALKHVHELQRDDNAREQIGLNGKLWAFGQDHTTYMNELRSLLRGMGV